MATNNAVSTLKQLITRAMQDKGLSRSRLMQAMDVKNITKGLRRLDQYLQTLAAPSDDFVIRLLTALDINGLDFCRAVTATQEKMIDDAGKVFSPYLQVLLSINIRGVFAWQAVHNRCIVPVPNQLQERSFTDELAAVIAAYKEHVETSLDDMSLWRHVTGFLYYRSHKYSLQFSAGLTLVDIKYSIPSVPGKQPLANRVANLLTGDM